MKNMFKARKQRKGFSLVELVVVILIIAILAVAVFAGGSAVIKKSQVSRTTSDLHNFSVAVEAFLNENPSVANTGSYKDMNAKKVLETMNAGLAEDYRLTLLTAAETGNITSTKGVPADADLYFIASLPRLTRGITRTTSSLIRRTAMVLVSPTSSSRLFLLARTLRRPSTAKSVARTIPRRTTCSSWFSTPTVM